MINNSIIIFHSFEANFLYITLLSGYWLYFSLNSTNYIHDNFMIFRISLPFIVFLSTYLYNFNYLITTYNLFREIRKIEFNGHSISNIIKHKKNIKQIKNKSFTIFVFYYCCLQFLCEKQEVNKYSDMTFSSFYCYILNCSILFIINKVLPRQYIYYFNLHDINIPDEDINNIADDEIKIPIDFQKLIEQKLIFTNISVKNNTTCSICFNKINKSNATKTICEHIFHRKCLEIWFNKSLSCPLCRNEFAVIT